MVLPSLEIWTVVSSESTLLPGQWRLMAIRDKLEEGRLGPSAWQ